MSFNIGEIATAALRETFGVDSRGMLLKRLNRLAVSDSSDIEALSCEAVDALLDYIHDAEVAEAFKRVPGL